MRPTAPQQRESDIGDRSPPMAPPRADAGAGTSPAVLVGTEHRRRAVQAEGLGRRFGPTWALSHVDLSVERGEAVLVIGANGSGKTTLLRLLAGLYRPSTGTLRVLDHDLPSGRFESRRRLSFVGHDSYLYGRLTALETIEMWSRFLGLRQPESASVRLLAEVGLDARRHVVVDEFSAGMRKRLTLARARLENPELLLLDEPLSALDAEGMTLVREWIRESKAAGSTVVIASHDVVGVAPMCDRAVLLRDGQIAWDGAASQTLPGPRSET